MPEFPNQQTPTRERNPKTPESNKFSTLTKTALALTTMAVVNISYSPITKYFNRNEQTKSANASSLVESANEDIDRALNNSYPLWEVCKLDGLSGKALGIAVENCGKRLRWTQEEIDEENRINSEMFAMMFLFWLDIGGGSPKPSASQIDTLATQVSKTPKQSATFRSATGERVTLRSKPGGTTLDAEIRTRNGKTIRKSEPVNRNKPRNAEEPAPKRSNPRELEAPCLSANPTNPSDSNNLNIASLASNNLTPREKLASLLERIRTRGFDSMLGIEVAEARNCLKEWNNVNKEPMGIKSLKEAQTLISELENLPVNRVRIDGGSSGELARGFKGEPNTVYITKGNHIVVTDSLGNALLDIDKFRIKIWPKYQTPQGKIIKPEIKYPDFMNPDALHYVPEGKILEFIENTLKP
jgi:hypothetical protein